MTQFDSLSALNPMFDAYLPLAGHLLVAFLFGGMLFFSSGFAAFLFKHLQPAEARMLIRKVFPPFYLFVIFASGLAAVMYWISDPFNSALMASVTLTAVAARQVLMPAINRATDLGMKKRFMWLHGFSVVVTLTHILLAAVVLCRTVN